MVHKTLPRDIQYMQPDHLTEASNVFLGKFSNRDSIILPVDLQDYPTGYTAEDLFFEYENRCGFQEYPMDGFQVYPDASSSMIFNTARFPSSYNSLNAVSAGCIDASSVSDKALSL